MINNKKVWIWLMCAILKALCAYCDDSSISVKPNSDAITTSREKYSSSDLLNCFRNVSNNDLQLYKTINVDCSYIPENLIWDVGGKSHQNRTCFKKYCCQVPKSGINASMWITECFEYKKNWFEYTLLAIIVVEIISIGMIVYIRYKLENRRKHTEDAKFLMENELLFNKKGL
uniref:Uncharacterized protein n=1 Tax=Acrobeloides nanus TaxID=290746 RepID=A0A914CQK9_9BILA